MNNRPACAIFAQAGHLHRIGHPANKTMRPELPQVTYSRHGRTACNGLYGIVRVVGALLLKQNDEWVVQRALYMTLETMAQMSDDPQISLPAVALISLRH